MATTFKLFSDDNFIVQLLIGCSLQLQTGCPLQITPELSCLSIPICFLYVLISLHFRQSNKQIALGSVNVTHILIAFFVSNQYLLLDGSCEAAEKDG